MTELSFHGIHTLRKKTESVTHVSGTNCHLCLGPLTGKIRLAKKYVDYDDYKNDPHNLTTSEIPRVERMMTEARIGSDFADWKDFIAKTSTIKFPGYGSGPGPRIAAGGLTL
jgi:hypothetical protein